MGNDLYKGEFFDNFSDLEIHDDRQAGKVHHRLIDVLFIVFCGIICGYDDRENIHVWASANATQRWIKKYIELRYGIPSISTFKRCFTILNLKNFQIALLNGYVQG